MQQAALSVRFGWACQTLKAGWTFCGFTPDECDLTPRFSCRRSATPTTTFSY